MSQQLIYRHFSDARQAEQYLNGLWSGDGLHGDPERSGGAERCLLLVSRESIRLRLRPAEGGGKTRRSWQFFPPLAEWQCQIDADYLDARHEDWRLRLQALDGVRVHLSLDLAGQAATLRFAGALRRRSTLLQFWYQLASRRSGEVG